MPTLWLKFDLWEFTPENRNKDTEVTTRMWPAAFLAGDNREAVSPQEQRAAGMNEGTVPCTVLTQGCIVQNHTRAYLDRPMLQWGPQPKAATWEYLSGMDTGVSGMPSDPV